MKQIIIFTVLILGMIIQVFGQDTVFTPYSYTVTENPAQQALNLDSSVKISAVTHQELTASFLENFDFLNTKIPTNVSIEVAPWLIIKRPSLSDYFNHYGCYNIYTSLATASTKDNLKTSFGLRFSIIDSSKKEELKKVEQIIENNSPLWDFEMYIYRVYPDLSQEHDRLLMESVKKMYPAEYVKLSNTNGFDKATPQHQAKEIFNLAAKKLPVSDSYLNWKLLDKLNKPESNIPDSTMYKNILKQQQKDYTKEYDLVMISKHKDDSDSLKILAIWKFEKNGVASLYDSIIKDAKKESKGLFEAAYEIVKTKYDDAFNVLKNGDPTTDDDYKKAIIDIIELWTDPVKLEYQIELKNLEEIKVQATPDNLLKSFKTNVRYKYSYQDLQDNNVFKDMSSDEKIKQVMRLALLKNGGQNEGMYRPRDTESGLSREQKESLISEFWNKFKVQCAFAFVGNSPDSLIGHVGWDSAQSWLVCSFPLGKKIEGLLSPMIKYSNVENNQLEYAIPLSVKGKWDKYSWSITGQYSNSFTENAKKLIFQGGLNYKISDSLGAEIGMTYKRDLVTGNDQLTPNLSFKVSKQK
jgi:hypothetical protein